MTENSRLFGSRLETDTLQSESESHSDGSVLQKAVSGDNLSLADAATWRISVYVLLSLIAARLSKEVRMAENQTEPPGPDLTLGIPLSELPDGGKLVGRVGEEQVLLVRRGARSSPSARIAPTIAGLSPTGSSSMTRFTAPGTTPASTCEPAKRCARRR